MPEQAVTDGKGHVYVDIRDKDNVTAIDAKTLTVSAHYDLGGKGGRCSGLAIDVKSQTSLLPGCREPKTMVMLKADSGKLWTHCRSAMASIPQYSTRRQWKLTVRRSMAP